MALPVESVIRGRYLIQSQLGTGNVGDVYLVRDQLITWKSPILFAFKEVINPNRHQLYKITLDGMALRLLQHQALPHVYNVLSDAKHDRVYVQMEYIEGSNLDKLRLRRPESRFSFPETITIMTPIMDAVAYLHSQRSPVTHQDIKPANIIVSLKKGRVMLVNFGVGKQYKMGSTARHSLTPYQAPEQYNGEINTLTDIYGLGATLYTLVTGIVPLDALYREQARVSIH
jgi:serine/threonine protein kinase